MKSETKESGAVLKAGTSLSVVASDKPWHDGLTERLSARSGSSFRRIRHSTDLTKEHLDSLSPRWVFFPHWSHRIPEEVYESYECVIFHMTDLPFGRGGSPLQNLIARGIYETQMTALRCVEGLDAGPIYLKRPLSLHGAAEEIFIRASIVIEEMILDIMAHSPDPKPQEGEVTIFRRRRPEEGNLEGAKSMVELFDMIRMLDASGYPRAFLQVGEIRYEFSRAVLTTDGVLASVQITRVPAGEEK
jgi:methionyl-tRNA formyltransferase